MSASNGELIDHEDVPGSELDRRDRQDPRSGAVIAHHLNKMKKKQKGQQEVTVCVCAAGLPIDEKERTSSPRTSDRSHCRQSLVVS